MCRSKRTSAVAHPCSMSTSTLSHLVPDDFKLCFAIVVNNFAVDMLHHLATVSSVSLSGISSGKSRQSFQSAYRAWRLGLRELSGVLILPLVSSSRSLSAVRVPILVSESLTGSIFFAVRVSGLAMMRCRRAGLDTMNRDNRSSADGVID